MKKLLLIGILLLNITHSFCQYLKRNNGESVEEFVRRTIPNSNSKINGKVIETEWNSKTLIIAFIAVVEIQKSGDNQFEETNIKG